MHTINRLMDDNGVSLLAELIGHRIDRCVHPIGVGPVCTVAGNTVLKGDGVGVSIDVDECLSGPVAGDYTSFVISRSDDVPYDDKQDDAISDVLRDVLLIQDEQKATDEENNSVLNYIGTRAIILVFDNCQIMFDRDISFFSTYRIVRGKDVVGLLTPPNALDDYEVLSESRSLVSLESGRKTAVVSDPCEQVESHGRAEGYGIPHNGKARRTHRRDVFNLWLLEGLNRVEPTGMPSMEPVDAKPPRLVPFSEVVAGRCRDYEAFVDFYEDDYRIEKAWADPVAALKAIEPFAGCVAPDYSTCRDFPVPLKIMGLYRNQTLGAWFQRMQMCCVPNVRWDAQIPEWSFAGVPSGGTVALGARACVKSEREREALREAVRHIVDDLSPARILWYGSVAYGLTDYALCKGVEVSVYPGRSRGALH